MQLRPVQTGGSRQTAFSTFVLLFGLSGFAVAQTVYGLILGTPEFLIARQNTQADLWLLAGALSFGLPLLLSLPGIVLAGRLYLARAWAFIAALLLCGLFVAQLLQDPLGHSTGLFFLAVLAAGGLLAALLVFTRFRLLGPVLALLALSFPVMFLLNAPDLDDGGAAAVAGLAGPAHGGPGPPVVMVLADELSLATLLDESGEIDANLFPNIYELRQSSSWYRNATTVADGTLEAVSAILTGRMPRIEAVPATIASLPANLFTLLPAEYRFNVVESLSRLCPDSRCPTDAAPTGRRFTALLLDLTALFLHRVAPAELALSLPNVADNWSGFFAAKQEFFPGGWVAFAEGQAKTNRPGIFRDFVDAVRDTGEPRLDFIHILYPHVPYAYLPDGRNYGNHWLRGLQDETWSDSGWGVLNGKQRYFLQAQHFDRLLGELLARLREENLFDRALVMLMADHGVAIRRNDSRRALSETNPADILRVPLFIKQPGQSEPEISDDPVMTVDILPTVLGALGLKSDIAMDGIDLARERPSADRERPVLSYKRREFQAFTQPELSLGGVIRENRRQLKLDRPGEALWGVGPLVDYHGEPLDRVCSERVAGVSHHASADNLLPDTPEQEFVPAFVSGTLGGDIGGEVPFTFVVAHHDMIVGSGETWALNGTHHYFTLVDPAFIDPERWSPEIWVVEDGACRGASGTISVSSPSKAAGDGELRR